jgi:hypothetical protein
MIAASAPPPSQTVPAAPVPVRQDTRRSSASTRIGLVVLTVLATLSVVVPGLDPFRGPLVFLAAVLVPGAALLEVLPPRVLRDPSWPTWLAVAFGLSIATVMLGSLAMTWTFQWHPELWLAVLAVGSTVALVFPRSGATPPVELRRPDAVSLATLGLAALGLVLWWVSLPDVPTTQLSDFGLSLRMPLLWWAGLLCAVAALLMSLAFSRSDAVSGTVLAALVLVLFGTLPALGVPPQYSWVYKHFGVVQFIEAGHGAGWFSGDIYQRWPGFFSTAAVVGQVAGRPDPVAYAAWAEPFFALVDAFLVVALARALGLGRRTCWGAALLFSAANWVGQTYFSPQALAFALQLTFFVVLLQWTTPTTARPLLTRALSPLRWRWRGAARPGPTLRAISPPLTAVAVLVLLQACITVTHQLTPYLLVMELAAVVLVTPVRPRWLWALVAALPVLYLLPNFAFVQSNFGLFTSFDILRNVARTNAFGEVPSLGKHVNGLASQALSFTIWLACPLVMLLRLRTRRWDRRLLAALFVSPFLLVLGQDYGGEASLRVFLFTVPWAALAISATMLEGARRAWSVAWGALALAVVVLFVPAFYGASEINLMPRDEVRASAEVYRIGRPGGVLVLAAPNFPRGYSAQYGKFGYSASDDIPSLLHSPDLRGRHLGSRRDVDRAVGLMKSLGPYGFLAFGSTSYVYAEVFNLTPPGQLENLERAVSADPRFRLVVSGPNVRVYALGNAVLPNVSTPIRVSGRG